MKLWVLIVNYRTPQLTLGCVRSLLPLLSEGIDVRAVVIDNCSADGSAELLKQELPRLECGFPISFIVSPRNGGFAYGNNEAIRQCLAEVLSGEGAGTDEFVWLLNPDAYLQANAVRPLLEFFHDRPQVGIVGSRIEDEDGGVRCSAFRQPTLWSEIDATLGFGPLSRLLERYRIAPPPSAQPHQTDWVSGASLFMRAELLSVVGLMDERYFMYFEETDYCLAAQAHGYQVWYWPDFSVVHLAGQASGVTGKTRMLKRRPKYWFDSRDYFFRKHHGAAYLHLANLAWLLCYPVGRAWRAVRCKPNENPPRLWWDFLRYSYLGAK